MRTFRLYRREDVGGISGIGYVAEGVEFHDKQVVFSWFGKYHSMETHPSIEQVIEIHGHSGRTVIEWNDSANSLIPNGDSPDVGP
jgi:hypothetical protein